MNRQEHVIQETRFLQNGNAYYAAQGTSSVGLCHSEMAMHAAKKMRRSRQKLKTGRVVCHHLRMMLAANESVPTVSSLPSSSDSRSFSRSLSRSLSRSSLKREETQFSLGI